MTTRTVWSRDLTSQYTLGPVIGKGQYGCVSAAKRLPDQRDCVVKIVARTDNYIRELDHLISLKDCYKVLPIKRAVLTHEQLCMEFSRAESSLFDYVRKVMRGMTVAQVVVEALAFTAHILSALHQTHQLGIAHRDLKTGNIVVMKNWQTPDMEPWIIDWGMSKRIGIGGKDISTYEIVTCSYRAPELWEAMKKPSRPGAAPQFSHPNKGRIYDHKVDVWSAGCILYEMLTGTGAFGGEDRGPDSGAHGISHEEGGRRVQRV